MQIPVPFHRPRVRAPSAQRAFTLVEVLIAVVLVATLAAVAYPSYVRHVEKARVRSAISDIQKIEMVMERYFSDHYEFPPTLAHAGLALTDPWGNPYKYLRLSAGTIGKARKDKSLVPINSDYDLYSMGADGKTAAALTAKVSQDDVIRASNGSFHGLGSDY
ncbi:type IV pilin protein [Piscinibacter sp.]|uniref:type IV pilin protein n=1 Tax=Piscinibacter sp. TaxID=1903157 RepID=UPI002B597037|nr:prepilin-type N-terminal cleavage/methylation domain-containing protein [Albitalea sp.]HUG25672.1 prepilin-type N-terminal cleavage/methylation domain-containing protein [Albitalea sp.]